MAWQVRVWGCKGVWSWQAGMHQPVPLHPNPFNPPLPPSPQQGNSTPQLPPPSPPHTPLHPPPTVHHTPPPLTCGARQDGCVVLGGILQLRRLQLRVHRLAKHAVHDGRRRGDLGVGEAVPGGGGDSTSRGDSSQGSSSCQWRLQQQHGEVLRGWAAQVQKGGAMQEHQTHGEQLIHGAVAPPLPTQTPTPTCTQPPHPHLRRHPPPPPPTCAPSAPPPAAPPPGSAPSRSLPCTAARA